MSSNRGLTVVEMLIALLLAALIMAGVYQTIRLQWQSLSRTTQEARLESEARRVLSTVEDKLRNSGYNPRHTPYDMQNDLTRRIGLVAAGSESLVFTNDEKGAMDAAANSAPDGLVATAATLDARHMPVEGKTDAAEVGALRLNGERLESFAKVNGRDGWQMLADGIEGLHILYYNDKGEPSVPAQGTTDPKILAKVRRIEFKLSLNDKFRGKKITKEAVAVVTLRNLPFLTGQETP